MYPGIHSQHRTAPVRSELSSGLGSIAQSTLLKILERPSTAAGSSLESISSLGSDLWELAVNIQELVVNMWELSINIQELAANTREPVV